MRAESSTLEYAPHKPSHRRLWRRLFIALILLAAGIAAFTEGGGICGQAVILWRQHRCLTYTAPATQIVLTDDPSYGLPFSQTDDITTLSQPDSAYAYCAPAMASLNGVVANVWPEDNTPGWPATVFMHGRRSARGEERLVVVAGYYDGTPRPGNRLGLSGIGVGKAGLTGPPFGIEGDGKLDVSNWGECHTTVYAGQIDPRDESHFTIRVVHGGKTSTIDGWLQDDDTVTLKEQNN